MKKRSFTIFILLFGVFISSFAQKMGRVYNHQFIGGGIGIPYYSGDIQQTIGLLRPGAQLFWGMNVSKYANVRINVMGGLYGAADSLSSTSRKDRNLSFQSPIIEITALMEWEILRSFNADLYNKTGLSPYVAYGLGVFYMSPSSKYQGKTYDLQSLGTEGQYLTVTNPGTYPKPYSKIQPCLPLVFGLKYFVNKNIAIVGELGYRRTFTDYMDDSGSGIYPDKASMQAYNPIAAYFSDPRKAGASTGEVRGNPKKNDNYFFPNLSVLWYMKGGKAKTKNPCKK